MGKGQRASGYQFTPDIIGKRRFHVRERYVAEHVAPLVRSRRAFAAKLDVVLRSLALLPDHAGEREPGTVLRRHGQVGYAELFDLVDDPARYSTQPAVDRDHPTRPELDAKQKRVGDNLRVLEERGLLRRDRVPDGSTQIVMLSDTGDGHPFDDPDGKAPNSYVTVSSAVLASAHFRGWGGPELAAYYCAMVADRYALNRAKQLGHEPGEPGSGTWYRQAAWFNNENGYRGKDHVVLPFVTRTIEQGLRELRRSGLIAARGSTIDPTTNKKLTRERLVYTNQFADLETVDNVIELDARRTRAS